MSRVQTKKVANPVPKCTSLPVDPSHAQSLWECPLCGKKLWFSQADLSDVGTPICGGCDIDMNLAEDNDIELTSEEIEMTLRLARLALGDGEVFDTVRKSARWTDKQMKALQDKLTTIYTNFDE